MLHTLQKGTLKERIVRITNKRKLSQLFTVDRNGEPNFRKNVTGRGHVDLTVNDSKSFVITYNYSKENVNILCH